MPDGLNTHTEMHYCDDIWISLEEKAGYVNKSELGKALKLVSSTYEKDMAGFDESVTTLTFALVHPVSSFQRTSSTYSQKTEDSFR